MFYIQLPHYGSCIRRDKLLLDVIDLFIHSIGTVSRPHRTDKLLAHADVTVHCLLQAGISPSAFLQHGSKTGCLRNVESHFCAQIVRRNEPNEPDRKNITPNQQEKTQQRCCCLVLTFHFINKSNRRVAFFYTQNIKLSKTNNLLLSEYFVSRNCLSMFHDKFPIKIILSCYVK